MSDSMNEILKRIQLQSNDLNNTSPEIIQEIFGNLTIREISSICRTSSTFNDVCEKESLWKNKAWNDYRVNKNSEGTWRKTAKEVFLESEQFWSIINESINYFMTDTDSFSQICDDINDIEEVDKLINKFEKNLADHALREEKEFYAVELIFKSFYDANSDIDSLEDDYFYVNFIPLFEKVAKLSPEGKISLKWVLNLNHNQEVKLTEIDPDDLDVDLISDYRTEKYKIQWCIYNRNLYCSLPHLVNLYRNCKYLFVDDTTSDQKDIVMMLNYQGISDF